jgi:hypothetical protein
MSHNELQNLLYGALASGSQANHEHHAETAAALASQCNVAAVSLSNSTPAEIIAHYDFRVRNARQIH